MILTVKAFVIRQLRKSSYRWGPRNAALYKARVGQDRIRGRLVWQYSCVQCPIEVRHSRTAVAIDHVLPVVTEHGFTTWDSFIERMFCQEDGYQVLCKDHHQEKTNAENRERREKRQCGLKKKKKRKVSR